ncbi:hypothetical protein L9F63_009363, partial [Diploptera punctata]
MLYVWILLVFVIHNENNFYTQKCFAIDSIACSYCWTIQNYNVNVAFDFGNS